VSVTIPRERETMLIVSETWLTTQASSVERGWTETGPIPTGISVSKTGADWVTSNTESRASGVLTAKRRVPSADNRIGFVWAASKFTNDAGFTWAVALMILTAVINNAVLVTRENFMNKTPVNGPQVRI
jgi:hypothetical protein